MASSANPLDNKPANRTKNVHMVTVDNGSDITLDNASVALKNINIVDNILSPEMNSY